MEDEVSSSNLPLNFHTGSICTLIASIELHQTSQIINKGTKACLHLINQIVIRNKIKIPNVLMFLGLREGEFTVGELEFVLR